MTVTPTDHKRSIKKNAVTKKVYICNDSDLADELGEIQERLNWLGLRASGNLTTAEEDREMRSLKERETQLKAEIKEGSLLFIFRSIGRKAYDALIDEHQPTETDKKYVEDHNGDPSRLIYSPTTFPPALCAAALIEPKDFDMNEAWNSDDWNQAELTALFEGALEANSSRRIVPLGNE